MTIGEKFKGYLLGMAAAVSYGLNPSFALPLYADGMNPESVLFLRYGIAVLLLGIVMILRGGGFSVPKRSILPLAVLGVLMAFSSLALFLSYNYMAAGIASTILFVYPILVAVIMTLCFKEKFKASTGVCLVIATGGILLLYHTGEGETLSLFGTLMVVASAAAYAIYLVGINHKKVSRLSSLPLTFYVLCFGILLFVIPLLSGTPFILPTKWYLWLSVIALAALPTMVSLVCTTAAIQRIGSTPTAILGALEPVTALVMGMLFFDEGMTGREALGIVMILVSVSAVILSGSRPRIFLRLRKKRGIGG